MKSCINESHNCKSCDFGITNYLLSKKSLDSFAIGQKVIVLAKYSDLTNMYLEESANIFLEYIKVNEHLIKLEDGKQPPYGSI